MTSEGQLFASAVELVARPAVKPQWPPVLISCGFGRIATSRGQDDRYLGTRNHPDRSRRGGGHRAGGLSVRGLCACREREALGQGLAGGLPCRGNPQGWRLRDL